MGLRGMDCGRVWLARGLALALALLLLAPSHAADQKPLKGVALVIGEADYGHLAKLANPANDARAVDRLLSDLGFEVVTVVDANRAKLARSLERFAEDAAEADVALLYYSGHGIEAGGEDFLVPVDADVSAPGDAGNQLLPLSATLDRLKSSVPVTIVLLDACRTSPFPNGSTIMVDGRAAPVAATGLAAPKGAMTLAPAAKADAGLATVVGFAAEPGKVALDGAAGGNSPYAAALLKHLPVKGFDFGDVMTMVTEEVYLDTRGQQRPWTNASLRRLLYFGMDAAESGGDEAAIRGERRKLLLTIATTPSDRRDLVETIARQEDVPLDQLYGMLEVLDVDVSAGRGDLERQLRTGADKLRTILANRDAVQQQDGELIRLSGLADEAEKEGAMQLALDYRARASLRADAIGKAVDEAEAGVRARRAELADTYRRHAETAVLNFDYATAAQKYAAAYEQAVKFDPVLAYALKLAQGDAELDFGTYSGDRGALEGSIASYRAALDAPPRGIDRIQLAMAASNLGNALTILGEREPGTARFEEAARTYEAVLKVFSRKRHPQEWAGAQLNLGTVYQIIGQRGGDAGYLKKSVAAYRDALKELPEQAVPLDWAGTQNNLGNALSALSELTGNHGQMAQAIDAYAAALKYRTRDAQPVAWAEVQTNLGVAYRTLGSQRNDMELLRKSADYFRAALEVETRDRMAFQWAGTMNNLANALEEIGNRETGTARYEEAVTALRATLEVFTPDSDPVSWAGAHYNLGRIIKAIGDRDGAAARYREALGEFRQALGVLEKAEVPLLLSRTQGRMAEALLALGRIDRDPAMLAEAQSAYRSAWNFWKAQGETRYDKYFKDQLAEVDEAAAALR